jgi:hypothetical protein
MSNEWAHDCARKGVPTVNKLDGYAVSTDTHAYLAVAGACLPSALPAQLVQDSSGFATMGTAMPSEVVVARPRTQLQKYPFTTQGAAINGASSGPHRAWDPV